MPPTDGGDARRQLQNSENPTLDFDLIAFMRLNLGVEEPDDYAIFKSVARTEHSNVSIRRSFQGRVRTAPSVSSS
jgi:hypothetical protein